jgi:cytochrome c5
MGGDEVNRISAGKDYGWPTITYGRNYTTQRIGVGTTFPGMEQPLVYYLPSIAASPITVYRGDMFPDWEGHLLIGSLNSGHINKLDLVDGAVKSEQRILTEVTGRFRDIKVAPDGSIYFLVENGGRIYRLYRDPGQTDVNLDSGLERPGEVIYTMICASCHSAGQGHVPQRSDTAYWQERLNQAGAALYQNTWVGINAMPPKGLCENCTETEIRAAVDYLLNAE